MEVINITNVKANFSRLIERASKGEPFIISVAGKPIARVEPIDELESVKTES